MLECYIKEDNNAANDMLPALSFDFWKDITQVKSKLKINGDHWKLLFDN